MKKNTPMRTENWHVVDTNGRTHVAEVTHSGQGRDFVEVKLGKRLQEFTPDLPIRCCVAWVAGMETILVQEILSPGQRSLGYKRDCKPNPSVSSSEPSEEAQEAFQEGARRMRAEAAGLVSQSTALNGMPARVEILRAGIFSLPIPPFRGQGDQ